MLGTCCLYSGEAPLAILLRSNEDIRPYMDSIIILFYCVVVLWGTPGPQGAGRRYHLNWGGERRRHVKAAWYQGMISSWALLWQGNNSCLPTGLLLCCWCQRKSAAELGCTIASVVPARALGSVKLVQRAGLGMAHEYQHILVRQPDPSHTASGCYYFAVSMRGLIGAEIRISLGSLSKCDVAIQAVAWLLHGVQAKGGRVGSYHPFITF